MISIHSNGQSKILMYLIIILLIPIFAFAGSDDDALLSALALNYCRNSLVKIQSYNDRIVLDEEYNNIINNIDLSKINDEEIIELLEDLMDTLSYFKLQEGDKVRLMTKYEKKVSNAFYSSFSGVTNIIYAGGGNPYAIAAVALTQVGGAYANYRKNLDEYRQELDDKMWQLEKGAIEQINDIQKSFLRNSWILMKKRDIPDSWRLTDSQLNEYVEILKDDNVERRLRRLGRVSKFFDAYPPYWYYLGVSSMEAKNKPNANDAFNKFNQIRRGFFREDNVYTSALMNKILLFDPENDTEEIINLLNKMVNQSTKDWRKNLFAALKYAECGHLKEAKELIQINIDNNQNVSLNMRVLGELYMLEKNKQKLLAIIETMVKEDRVRGQDVLYFLGKVPEIRMLNKMKTSFTEIDLYVDDSLLGNDDIEIFIPIKWIMEDFEKFNIQLKIKNDSINPTSLTADEGRNGVVYTFEDAIKMDDVLAQIDSLETTISLNHPSGSFKIEGLIKKNCTDKEKGLLSKGVSKAKNLTNKWLGSGDKKEDNDKETVCEPTFLKKNIITSTGTYIIEDDRIISKR
jgi:hypothetical protein